MFYAPQVPMMPLAHMINNPMNSQSTQMRKPDFPPDMQPIFVIPQIAHIKSQPKPKCRSYEPVISKGPGAEWIIDKFEDEEERMQREEREKDLVKPSRVPPRVLKKIEKKRIYREELKKKLFEWNPFEDPNVTQDPYKTLFVGRLNYKTTERKLRREFEEYGPIKTVRIIKSSGDGKPRGYAFIEFEQKTHLKQAYKYAVDKRIDERKIVVDIERGRTIIKWRPRRLGGGLGDLRRSRSEEMLMRREREEESRRRQEEKTKTKKREKSEPKKKHKKHEESEKKKNKKHEEKDKGKKKHK